MNIPPISRTLVALLVLGSALLAGCRTTKTTFSDLPEPWRSDLQQTLLKEPNSKFALACHGDPAALHDYFGVAAVPLDSSRFQTYSVTILAIYQYLGRRRFLAALTHESPQIRQAMIPHVPYALGD